MFIVDKLTWQYYNESAKQTWQRRTAMDKNEILAKSRNENKNADERENIIKKNAYLVSSVVGIIVCGIFYIIEDNITYFIIWFSINSVAEVYQAAKLKKTYNIISCLISLVILGVLIAVYLSDKGVY